MQLYLELFSSQTEGDTSTDGSSNPHLPTSSYIRSRRGGISGEEWKHGPGIPRHPGTPGWSRLGTPGPRGCTGDKPASVAMAGVQHLVGTSPDVSKNKVREGGRVQ